MQSRISPPWQTSLQGLHELSPQIAGADPKSLVDSNERRVPRESILVSVRSSIEYRIARSMKLHRIDVKEPEHGSLGCPSPQTVDEILREHEVFAGQSSSAAFPFLPKLSIALGDIEDRETLPLAPDQLAPFEMIKVGVRNRANSKAWRSKLERWQNASLVAERFVLVHYPDATSDPLLDFDALLQISQDHDLTRMLLDTLHKDGRTLLDHLAIDQLAQAIQSAAHTGIEVMAAGSLKLDQLYGIWKAGAKIIGIRSAVCRSNSRVQGICPDRLRALDEFFINP